MNNINNQWPTWLTKNIKLRTILLIDLPYSGHVLLFFMLFFLPQDVRPYCWQVGWNPGFKEAPKIQQLTLAKVRVSWEGIVENRECVDQFLVKYWKVRGVILAKNGRERGWEEGYKLSEQVDNTINFTDIDFLTPKARYMFQAIAREDKGAIGGVEYNKSPATLFKTSLNSASRDPLIPGVSNELLFIIGIASLFGLVVVVGLVYKLTGYQPKIIIVEDDDDEDDLLDEKDIEDEDTKADELVGYLTARHIRSSISDITENPDSHMGSRRISALSEN